MIERETLVAGPDVSATVDKIMSGEVFTGLVGETAPERALGLETVLARVVDEGTRVAWIGNPLRSPLTMERFLLQIVGPEIDLRVERSPAALARLFAGRVGGESRLLVVVQQPETIDPETREKLAALAGHLGGEAVQVQFLFVGSPALRLPEVVGAELGRLAPPLPPVLDDRPRPVSRRRDLVPLVLLLTVTALGALFTIAAPIGGAEPIAAAAPVRPAPSGDTALAELRDRFDAFLAERAATLPPLSAAQKDVLFDEFLTRHRRE